MRIICTYIIFLCSLTTTSQTVEHTEIKVNPYLTILSDIKNDSVPHGKYAVVYKNNTILKGTTKEGEMDGVWIGYFNGDQKIKGRFVNGVKHGEWTVWGADGSEIAKFQYNYGKKIGHWQGYYSNRSKAIDIIYSPTGNLVQCIQYYPAGNISLNFEYDFDKPQPLAEYSYYFENQSIFQYEKYTDLKRNGSFQRYYDNGIIWENLEYANGDLMQVIETRSKGGMPRKNEDFRNGSGELRLYYPNGNTYSTTQYISGKRNGKIELFDLGGKPVGEGYFTDNKPVGHWKIFSEFHSLRLQVSFDSIPGLTYLIRKISPAQKERTEGPVKDGLRHGTWKTYDAYGELVSENNFQFGFMHGPQITYQSNKILQLANYAYGNKSGKSTYYSSFEEVLSEDWYMAESTIDSNWYISPEDSWVPVSRTTRQSNQVRTAFYPPFPGMKMHKSRVSYVDKKELMFTVQRQFGYNYKPELKPASFRGGSNEEKNYIYTNIKIPEELKSKRLSGAVLVRYHVDEFGIISKIKVLKTMGFGLDEAAVNVLKSLPPLNPATFNGIPIPCYVVREIDFKI